MLDQFKRHRSDREPAAIGDRIATRLCQALIVDRPALAAAQATTDALGAHLELKRAFTTDVSPILAMARLRAGGAIAPIEIYRASGYRKQKVSERPQVTGTSAGIV
jgi:L-rhamnose isomerase / sugar isomerase